MKLTKKLFMGALIATSLVCVPHVSKANVVTDILGWLENLGKDNKGHGHDHDHDNDKNGQGKNGKGWDNDPSPTSNSVPVDGGLVVLMVGGLGLGTMVIRKERRKSATILQ